MNVNSRLSSIERALQRRQGAQPVRFIVREHCHYTAVYPDGREVAFTIRPDAGDDEA